MQLRQAQSRPRLFFGERLQRLPFRAALFLLARDVEIASVLALAGRVVHEREQVDRALFDERANEIAHAHAFADVFVAEMNAGVGERVLPRHGAHAFDDLAAGETRGCALLRLDVAEVQRVVDCGDAAGDELPVQLLHGDVDWEIGAGAGGDLLLQRVGVQVDQPREDERALDIDGLQFAGETVAELRDRAVRRDTAFFD